MPARRFEDAVLPHLDAAYNYARWLTRHDADAEDVVHDACVRAMRYLSTLRGEDARSWLFAIVRNTWFSRAGKRARSEEDSMAEAAERSGPVDDGLDPERLLAQQESVSRVRKALERLPVEFREAIVLRDIEGLSYKEIAAVMQVPIGTVMSRIARGRERLLDVLAAGPRTLEAAP